MNKKLLPEREEEILLSAPKNRFKDYDRVIVAFSGGKDSLACVLHLLRVGCPPHKMELWHHNIDGCEASFMDWPCTSDYCRAVADHLGIELRFSWLKGGFEGEMFRENAPKASIRFELPDGTIGETGGKGKANTRRKQPAKGAAYILTATRPNRSRGH